MRENYFEGAEKEIFLSSEKVLIEQWNAQTDKLRLNNFFENNIFLDSIKKLSNITFETGHESGMKIYFKDDGRWAIAGLKEGGIDNYQSDTFIENAEEVYPNNPEAIYKAKLLLATLHFHPNPDLNINPSSEDIQTLINRSKDVHQENSFGDFNPIEIIMQIDNNQVIRGLIIQNQLYDEEKIANLMTNLDKCDYSQERIKEMLVGAGFKVAIIESDNKGNFSKKKLNKLNNFKFNG